MGSALVYVVVVGVVAGAVYLVAAVVFGRGEELAPMPPGATPTRLPARDLTGGDVRELRFQQTLRGYKCSEVDWALERLATEVDALRARLEVVTIAARADGADPGHPGHFRDPVDPVDPGHPRDPVDSGHLRDPVDPEGPPFDDPTPTDPTPRTSSGEYAASADGADPADPADHSARRGGTEPAPSAWSARSGEPSGESSASSWGRSSRDPGERRRP